MEMPALRYASSSSRPETRSNSKVVDVLKISGSGLNRTVVPLLALGPCMMDFVGVVVGVGWG